MRIRIPAVQFFLRYFPARAIGMKWLKRNIAMDEERHPVLFLWLRLVGAVCFLALGLLLFMRGANEVGFGVFFWIGPAVFCFLLAGLCCAPLVGWKLGNWFATVMFPDRHFDRPQPKYSIPASYRAQGRSEDAFSGFQKIAAEYPAAVRAYLEMMDIASRDLHNPTLAAAVFQQGISRVKEARERRRLCELYADIRADFPELPPAAGGSE
jgi:hypothetical protein